MAIEPVKRNMSLWFTKKKINAALNVQQLSLVVTTRTMSLTPTESERQR